ncbi:Hypothetical_protein [Hexamita inflata]|uniref:Hypothetical_protein n=1 Tax=Hexamita inflata TaxID=28002 RepID=A0AA86NAA7_9EUKA|nr:Hypothetical protein HINF_LOCUS3355 [Hexamita inflata]
MSIQQYKDRAYQESVQTTLDTSLSDLNGKAIIQQLSYGQDDYISLVSIRLTEEIYKLTGTITIYDDNSNIIPIQIFQQNLTSIEQFKNYIQSLETDDHVSVTSYFTIDSDENNILSIDFDEHTEKITISGNLYKAFGLEKEVGNKNEITPLTNLKENIYRPLYYKLVCNKINAGLSTFVNGQVQFDSNILTVLHPCCLEYQNKTFDTHCVINSNGPIEVQLQDDKGNNVKYQFMIQIKFYKQQYFIHKTIDGESINKAHQKQQMYLYTNDIINNFTFTTRPSYMAVSQLNGFIQLDPYDPNVLITGYVYKINFNNQFREYASASQYNISSLNNNVFSFIKVSESNVFRIKIRTFKIQYQNGLRTEVEVFDHKPKILIRLLVKT